MLAPSALRPSRRNSNRAAATRSFPGHLQWLRSLPCALARQSGCGGDRIEAAHVDHAGGKGVGLRVADYKAVPLCSDHHAEYHRGARSFEARYGIELVTIASAYAARSPHRRRWEDR